jgi:hypothetical protein
MKEDVHWVKRTLYVGWFANSDLRDNLCGIRRPSVLERHSGQIPPMGKDKGWFNGKRAHCGYRSRDPDLI